MDPMKVDPRYKNAALRGAWASGAVAVVCIILAMLAIRGFAGKQEHIPLLLQIALIGGVVSVLTLVIIKWMRL